MRRKIYDQLVEWKKSSKGKTALLIEGARRIGKSYIVEKFSQNVTNPIVLHTKDLEIKDGITYLPLYMTPLL